MEDKPKNKLMRLNTGSKSIHKGEIREGVKLVSWDCIQNCDPEQCPIGLRCIHAPKASGCQCLLQIEYINELTTTIIDQFPWIAQDDMYKFGMHLVPLYSNLCRMKIVEWSLTNVMVRDAKGNEKVHPIYREIRELIKTITSLWREMGFTRGPGLNGPTLPGEAGAKYGNNNGYGDPNHYSKISEEVDKKGVIR